MCQQCNNYVFSGDLAPRMWICFDTNKPTTEFYSTKAVIMEAVGMLGLTEEEAFEKAWEFFKHKQKQARINDTIYFCEDHFNKDLAFYWQLCLDTKKRGIKKNKLEIEVNIDNKVPKMEPLLQWITIGFILMFILFVYLIIINNK